MDSLVLMYCLGLARVASFVTASPILGGRSVPRLIKVGLVFAIALTWSEPQNSVVISNDGMLSWIGFGLLITREVILGASLGFLFALFMVPLRVAGEYIGQEMGFSMGSIANPTGDSQGGIVTQSIEALGVVLFFTEDFHHGLLRCLGATIDSMPIGEVSFELPTMLLVDGVSHAHEAGLLMAAPIGILLFIGMLALLFVMKFAPQMNLFTLGFSARIAVGLLALAFFAKDLIYVTKRSFESMEHTISSALFGT